MTTRAPNDAEVLEHRCFETADLRALKTSRRGRIRLLLEVNASRLARLLDLDLDDDHERVRCSEYATEAELFSAFERAAFALSR